MPRFLRLCRLQLRSSLRKPAARPSRSLICGIIGIFPFCVIAVILGHILFRKSQERRPVDRQRGGHRRPGSGIPRLGRDPLHPHHRRHRHPQPAAGENLGQRIRSSGQCAEHHNRRNQLLDAPSADGFHLQPLRSRFSGTHRLKPGEWRRGPDTFSPYRTAQRKKKATQLPIFRSPQRRSATTRLASGNSAPTKAT